MENHIRLRQPSNLNKYVEELNTKMKEEFTNTLTKIYNDDMKKYDDIINIIIQLPFVKRIIEENNSLREKLKNLDQSSNNVESIKLEISDKPISTSYVDLDKITFNQNNKAESSDSSDDTSSDEEEGSISDDEDEKPNFPSFPSSETSDIIVRKVEVVETMTESVDVEDEEPRKWGQYLGDGSSITKSVDKEVEEESDTENLEEDEEEVIEIEIDGETYYCDDEENGNIYKDEDGEVGNVCGKIKDGEATIF